MVFIFSIIFFVVSALRLFCKYQSVPKKGAVPIPESSTCMQQQQEQEAVTHGSESLNGGETPGQDHAPCPTAQKDGNLADEVSVYLFFL